MDNIKYAKPATFTEFNKRKKAGIADITDYLDFSLFTVNLKKPFNEKNAKLKSNVVDIVLNSCSPHNIIDSLEDMLRAIDFHIIQLSKAPDSNMEGLIDNIIDLKYECETLSHKLDRSSLFYKAFVTAQWVCDKEFGILIDKDLKVLFGEDLFDLISYHIDLRSDFWQLAATRLNYWLDKLISKQGALKKLDGISDDISPALLVDIVEILVAKKYVQNSVSRLALEKSLRELFGVNKEAELDEFGIL